MLSGLLVHAGIGRLRKRFSLTAGRLFVAGLLSRTLTLSSKLCPSRRCAIPAETVAEIEQEIDAHSLVTVDLA